MQSVKQLVKKLKIKSFHVKFRKKSGIAQHLEVLDGLHI